MPKQVDYFFEFGGELRQIPEAPIPVLIGGTKCELTGKSVRVCIDAMDHYSLEVRYIVPERKELSKSKLSWNRNWGLVSIGKLTIHPEQVLTRWVTIENLHCRAVTHETFSCTTS